MDQDNSSDTIVPVISEQVHADAVPVAKGGVRVTKRVEGHEEILEQELRRGRAEIRRIKTDRVVSGPQQPRQEGNTLIIPVISEVLVVTKQWVVTEEIYITRIEEVERVEQTVTVSHEVAEVERLDEDGNVIASGDGFARREIPAEVRPVGKASGEGTLSRVESILKAKKV